MTGWREVVISMGSDTLATDVRTDVGGIKPRPDSDVTVEAIAVYKRESSGKQHDGEKRVWTYFHHVMCASM